MSGFEHVVDYTYPSNFDSLERVEGWARDIWKELSEAQHGFAEDFELALSQQWSFKTITGITNDVVADQQEDTLTLAATGGILTIVGTAATDTITFDWTHLGIESLADPGADRIAFWDDGETAMKWLAPDGTTIEISGTTLQVIQSGIDHGSLAGLDGDDHPQYIKDSEFTQDSGFLVGTGAGTFAEETGATVRTSLGLGTGDSPTFVTTKLSGLTDGYVPYHVADATGLANSGIYWDSGNSRVGVEIAVPLKTLHIVGSGIVVEGWTPSWFFKETDGAANQNWKLALANGSIYYQTLNDALDVLNTRFFMGWLGNLGISQTTFGTNATNTLSIASGIAPTTSPAGAFQMYSADVAGAAGKAGVHLRDEAGNVTSIGDGQILDSSGAISFGNENLKTTGTSTLYGDIKTDRWLTQDTNTFIGVGACGAGLLEHTAASEGYYNTAIGYRALYSNTKGYYNTVIGGQAGYSNSTGYYNMAIGLNALYHNTSGRHNVATGMQALFSNVGGHYNIAVGMQAFYSNTEGDYNIAVGANAGRFQNDGSSALQTPENSIYLGANAKSGSVPAGGEDAIDNEIVIGHDAIGHGSNTVTLGNTSLTDVYINGALGLVGNGKVTKIVWLPFNALKAPGTKPATFKEWGISGVWEFSDATDDTVVANLAFPYDMDMTVAPSFRVGWSTNTTVTSETARWQLEYLYTAPGEHTKANAQGTIYIDSDAIAQADGLIVATFPAMDVPGSTDVCIHVRIKRLGATDDLTDTAELHGICMTYTADKLGA